MAAARLAAALHFDPWSSDRVELGEDFGLVAWSG